jgi:hypothetical protein
MNYKRKATGAAPGKSPVLKRSWTASESSSTHSDPRRQRQHAAEHDDVDLSSSSSTPQLDQVKTVDQLIDALLSCTTAHPDSIRQKLVGKTLMLDNPFKEVSSTQLAARQKKRDAARWKTKVCIFLIFFFF